MFSSDELLQQVNAALEAQASSRTPQSLYAPIHYVLSMGGKRLRPVLLLMAYNLYRDEVAPAMPAALGVEIYHNFTLMHDDLMDRAEYRRGKPCVHHVWGENAAILSGDTMPLLAARHILSAGMPALMDCFLETAIQIQEGQQYDMEFETRNDVTEDEYIAMIHHKTSVLLACALKLGAIQAGAPTADQEALYRFGEQLGLAFQLQDDYLDVYGDFATFGKRPGGDILCNKKTYMLINALSKATPAQHARLQQWLDATDYNPEEKVRAVTNLYNEIGVAALAHEKMNECYTLAEQSLAQVALPDSRKEVLLQYARSLMNRQS
ncbi:MAG: polyprenyl synthetase family protein [Bacteroidaceae bacterium]|nr:polyprenyl synthetase family protein [Bacteroidaceae bacterium]